MICVTVVFAELPVGTSAVSVVSFMPTHTALMRLQKRDTEIKKPQEGSL